MRKLSGANNKFEESKQLTDEFNTMKRHLKRPLYCRLLRLAERFIYIPMQVARDLALSSLNHTKMKRTETLIIIARNVTSSPWALED